MAHKVEGAMPTDLSPFPVDPAVLAAIRPMQNRDAEPVAALHEAAMGSSLWAQLGRRFLVELYRGLVDSPYFLGFVYEEDGVVKGFIAGSIDAEPMMRTLMRSRALVLGAAAAAGVLKRPQVLARLSDAPVLQSERRRPRRRPGGVAVLLLRARASGKTGLRPHQQGFV